MNLLITLTSVLFIMSIAGVIEMSIQIYRRPFAVLRFMAQRPKDYILWFMVTVASFHVLIIVALSFYVSSGVVLTLQLIKSIRFSNKTDE